MSFGKHFLTDEELARRYAALQEHGGSYNKAAAALGMDARAYKRSLWSGARRGRLGTDPILPGFEIAKTTSVVDGEGRLQRKFITQRPESGGEVEIPESHEIERLSINTDGDGNVRQQWIKTKADRSHAHQAAIEATIRVLSEGVVPAAPITPPATALSSLLTSYNIGDPHLGMYAWHKECNGGDFDLEIAERDLLAAADRLVAATPASDEAVICNLGDWFHTDNAKPFTPASGNLLDTGDSRWTKVVETGVRIQRRICQRALEKHNRVRLRNAKGNHDPHAGIILDVAMKAFFENEPRLIVEDSPRDLWWFQFGNNLVGVTHGHNCKPEKLPGVLAVDAREIWGKVTHTFIWLGHFHSKMQVEELETVVEVFRTLAPNDKWHSDSGYRSKKDMTAIVLHEAGGEIERHTAGLNLVRGTAI